MSHLENVSEDEINRLLGMVVDVENLFMSVHKEEDTDTKQVYFYLFKVCKRHSNISVIVIVVQLDSEVDVNEIFQPDINLSRYFFTLSFSCWGSASFRWASQS